MILGIDASNLRGGGGITHIVEFLNAMDLIVHDFSKVFIWGGEKTLDKIKEKPWLSKIHQTILDKSLPFRLYWQKFKLSKLASEAKCDILFVPGSLYLGNFHPVVTMSRNMLPFEWKELKRYGCSFFTIKMILLRKAQSNTFQKADGLIFLTQYAKAEVLKVIKAIRSQIAIIPHGIDSRFFNEPKEQLLIEKYSNENPYRIIYVSIIDLYKHQWHVVSAIEKLRNENFPIEIEFVGPNYSPALNRLHETMNLIVDAKKFVKISGEVPYKELHNKYLNANLCLFASSCENMPNILLEGMASGLPIACSNRGPMPEILGNAGVYFDPENFESIYVALKKLIESPDLRARFAIESSNRVAVFSWKRCADETVRFLTMIAKNN